MEVDTFYQCDLALLDFSIIILSSLLSTCIGVVVLLIKNGSVLQVNNDVMQSNWVHLYSDLVSILF